MESNVAAALLTLRDYFAAKTNSGMGKITFGDGIITVESMDYIEDREDSYVITDEYYQISYDAMDNEYLEKI